MAEEIKNEELVEVVDLVKDSQARRYLLTINNPSEEQTDSYMYHYMEELEHVKYFMFQRERGNEKGTEHFQIFIIFSCAKRFSTMKRLFEKAHIEKCKGSNVQCRDYCSKSDTRVSGPYEFGDFAEERSRSDIKTLIELVKSGAPNDQILELMPNAYMKYIDKIERVRQELLQAELGNKLKELDTVYLYGQSGVGKTYTVLTYHGINKVYRISDYDKDPWYSYKNQDVVMFDEFRSQINFSKFLMLTDVYPCEVSARYSNKYANFTKLYIVSNIPLEQQYSWYKLNEPESYKAFLRRIKFVLNYQKGKVYVEKAEGGIEKLKTLFPDSIINMLDFSRLNTGTNSRQQVMKFELVDDDPVF